MSDCLHNTSQEKRILSFPTVYKTYKYVIDSILHIHKPLWTSKISEKSSPLFITVFSQGFVDRRWINNWRFENQSGLTHKHWICPLMWKYS